LAGAPAGSLSYFSKDKAEHFSVNTIGYPGNPPSWHPTNAVRAREDRARRDTSEFSQQVNYLGIIVPHRGLLTEETLMREELSMGIAAAVLVCAGANAASMDAKEEEVAKLDTQFQAAVKVNDAEIMSRILHESMVLVSGTGVVSTAAEQIQEARDKVIVYEQQDEDPGTQTVRVWGDTAVVTARLWVKGVHGTRAFDKHVWFSDTYVRTPQGWRYVFGQVSLPAG
jgi:ketosteroid isomerase-like protein